MLHRISINQKLTSVTMRDLCVTQSASNCVYDASEDGLVPCRCSQRCPAGKKCKKCEHALMFGQTKDVIFGALIPEPLQDRVGKLLSTLPLDTDIVTIIVDMTKHEHMDVIKGEIETLNMIDEIDPEGIFTSKLIFEQKYMYDKNDHTMEIIDAKISKQERSERRIHPADCVCSRLCKEMKFHDDVKQWMKRKSDLHFVYMTYCGVDLYHKFPANIQDTKVLTAYTDLLLHYRVLLQNNICHMDLHAGNVVWNIRNDGKLCFKFIDFGFNIQYDESPPYKQEDVTQLFMQICDVSSGGLRTWHPVEYPMFHLCASMILHPIYVPEMNWDLRNHKRKCRSMMNFSADTTQGILMQFAPKTTEYRAALPNSNYELFNLWENILDEYSFLGEEILMLKWRKIVLIVDRHMSSVHFDKEGVCVTVNRSMPSVIKSSHEFTSEPVYLALFDVFRTQFYNCPQLDLNVVNAEFDVFSLGVRLLTQFQGNNTSMVDIILKYLMCHDDSVTAYDKLTNTTNYMRKLTALVFDKPQQLMGKRCEPDSH